MGVGRVEHGVRGLNHGSDRHSTPSMAGYLHIIGTRERTQTVHVRCARVAGTDLPCLAWGRLAGDDAHQSLPITHMSIVNRYFRFLKLCIVCDGTAATSVESTSESRAEP